MKTKAADEGAFLTLAESAELKKRLVADKDLGKVQDYFFRNFVERGTLLSMGRPLPNERGTHLIKIVSEAYARYANERLLSVDTQFVEVPQYNLIHGSVTVNGKQGSLLYCEDLGVGLFTLVWNPRTGETKYVRFVVDKPVTKPPN